MERGFVSAIALNGAGLIHDFEVALAGATSEDVEAVLGPGQFGMAEETGRELNDAIATASAQAGTRTGRRRVSRTRAAAVRARQPPLRGGPARRARHRARRRSAPTSSTCTRPRQARRSAPAVCATSGSSRRSSRSLPAACTSTAARRCILPEVFLKAVSLVRNRGLSLDGLTTVNLDFVRLYRPRPTSCGVRWQASAAATHSSVITNCSFRYWPPRSSRGRPFVLAVATCSRIRRAFARARASGATARPAVPRRVVEVVEQRLQRGERADDVCGETGLGHGAVRHFFPRDNLREAEQIDVGMLAENPFGAVFSRSPSRTP